MINVIVAATVTPFWERRIIIFAALPVNVLAHGVPGAEGFGSSSPFIKCLLKS